ncbi:MAG: serine protease [Bacteroidota bacterium]|nr:serine protease [Bacteroidota bacterium]
MKILITLPFFFLLNTNNCISQSITIDENSFGFIVLDDTMYNGTGFVLSSPTTVITCAHVIDSTKKISFVPYKTGTPFVLKLIWYDINNDIAVLQSQKNICRKPLLPDTAFLIQTRQHLFYIGYDVSKSKPNEKAFQVNNAVVSAFGKAQSGNTVVNFLEFNGVGIPGYSGGPVFNDEGKVVALMREAWFKQGIKGGQVQLINRAFSLKALFER